MELIEIGRFGKTFGVNGQLKCQVEPAYLDDILQSDALFVKINGHPVPYFPESFEEGPELSVIIDEISSREDAQILSGKVIFLRKEDLIATDKKEVPDAIQQFHRWLGFSIIDQSLGIIGTINGFLELPQQLLAEVNYQDKEVLIPFQADLVVGLDEEQRTISMDLPDGLLEL